MDYQNRFAFCESFKEAITRNGLGDVVSIEKNENNCVIAANIGPLEIPQYPMHLVKKYEPVRIVVKDHELPVVHCREDFPIVPHLNILEDGSITLCLYDLPYEEIKYLFNATVFLKRIVWWFEQTAVGKLHRPDQPLEPYYAGASNGLILNTFHFEKRVRLVRLKSIETSSVHLYEEISLLAQKEGDVFCAVHLSVFPQKADNIIKKLPCTLGELDDEFPNTPILSCIESCIPVIWDIKKTREYKELFNQTEGMLKKVPLLLLLHIPLYRNDENTIEKDSIKAFRIDASYSSLCSAFGYSKDKKGTLAKCKPSDMCKSISITPFEVFYALDREYALLLNHRNMKLSDSKYVQIGLGTLGSQIADNCIRSGFGKWTYVDPDFVLPHNLARHVLTNEDVGKNKAVAMEQYANSIVIGEDRPVMKAVPYSIFDVEGADELKTAISSSDLVVECSASLAVERYLAHELLGNVRAVSFFMNPTGSDLVMLLEDESRSISLAELEMRYYQALLEIPSLHDHLHTLPGILYSTACRNASVVYPQDNAAIFSGICSNAIKQSQKSKEAAIMIWTMEQYSPKEYRIPVDEYHTLFYELWKVRISSALERKLYDQRQRKLPNETGGVLIGSTDFEHRICYIVDALDPPADSKEYPCAFIRGSDGLKEAVDNVIEITGGNLKYVGEWHSHPTNSTCASSDDKILLASIAAYTSLQGDLGCMLIVGETQMSCYFECP